MFPNLSMGEKDWQNAELIFDIDAKDLRKEYPKENTIIKCSDCNEISSLNVFYAQIVNLQNFLLQHLPVMIV